MNQIREAYAPFEYAPDEILNSMFLPLIKKALIGGQRGQTPKLRYSSPSRLFRGEDHFCLPLMKIYLHLLKWNLPLETPLLVAGNSFTIQPHN
jgi:hypothetical protein